MPLPTPNSGETRSGFVSRCISFLSNEGSSIPAGAARSAACFSRWRQSKGGKPPSKQEIEETIEYCIRVIPKFMKGCTCEDVETILEEMEKMSRYDVHERLGTDERGHLVDPEVPPSSGQDGAIAGQYPEFPDLPKGVELPKRPYDSFADEEDAREVESP